jgi:hypothetical protein
MSVGGRGCVVHLFVKDSFQQIAGFVPRGIVAGIEQASDRVQGFSNCVHDGF